jgi:hypothetical protein
MSAALVVIVATASASTDLRLGAIAAGFARSGWDSFAAIDTARPPPNAAALQAEARRSLGEARRHRREQRHREAAASAEAAVHRLEAIASEKAHLALLVEALIERGAAAMSLGDAAKAEAVFLEAIALDPLHELDEELFGDELRTMFGEVQRASRQLPYGSIRIEVAALPGATASIDFDPPRDAPYEAKLADGRHFITASAPGRRNAVAFVPVRAGRRTDLSLRPPPLGEPIPQYTALVQLERTSTEIRIQGVPEAEATLSGDPSPAEIDGAVARLIAAVELRDPAIAQDDAAWYESWWLWTIVGVAVVGGVATAVVLTQRGDTEYRFEPP